MSVTKQAGSDKVLDYGDVLLRRRDVDLLDGPFWLNDQIITFYFDYLFKERFASDQSSLLFVGGAVTFLLSQLAGTGDISDIVAPLKLASRGLIFFAVNDNPDADNPEGGSHWTLAAFSQKDNTFFHYDSTSGRRNMLIARQIAQAVQPYIRGSAGTCKIEAAVTPVLTNAYDCGVSVLACAEAIAEHWLMGCSQKQIQEALDKQLTPSAVTDVRKKVLNLIHDKIAESSM